MPDVIEDSERPAELDPDPPLLAASAFTDANVSATELGPGRRMESRTKPEADARIRAATDADESGRGSDAPPWGETAGLDFPLLSLEVMMLWFISSCSAVTRSLENVLILESGVEDEGKHLRKVARENRG